MVFYGVSDLLRARRAEVRVASYHLDGNLRAEHTARDRAPEPRGSAPSLSLADLGVGYRSEVVPRDALGTTVPRRSTAICWIRSSTEFDGEGITYRNYLVRPFPAFRPPGATCASTWTARASPDRRGPAFGVFLETENDVDVSDNCSTWSRAGR